MNNEQVKKIADSQFEYVHGYGYMLNVDDLIAFSKAIQQCSDGEPVNCPKCNGKGTYDTSCTLCGDSTFDHECNDKTYACQHCKGSGILYTSPSNSDQTAKIKELQDLLNERTALAMDYRNMIADLQKQNDELKAQLEVSTQLYGVCLRPEHLEQSEQIQSLRKSICIYSREMIGNIDWQSDEQAINYMLSFTEENPYGDEALATVKGE